MHTTLSKPPQGSTQGNEQAAYSNMNQLVCPDSQFQSIFQMLPEDEAERKRLIERIIHKHNTSCSVPKNKIATVKPSFSSLYPKLATWIQNTFSDISANGMHLITFALARFPQYHDLVTSGAVMPAKANTQIIEDWFQRYGTELCSKALTDLSYLMKETGEFEFFAHDIMKFCSRVTPEAINKAAFEPVSGIRSFNRSVVNCYYASSSVFARLYLREAASIGHNSQSIMSQFGLSLKEADTMEGRFKDPYRAIMATMDDFIRSKASKVNLHTELAKRIKMWSDGGEGIKSFNEASSVIEEMLVSEAKKASLQPMGLKPGEHAGSSSTARKTPSSSKPKEETDTYDLC